jgi:hypothetical protein
MINDSSLIASWRLASTESNENGQWGDAEQWWTPAVDALADALVGQPVDAASACEALGRQRAAAGVFLDAARLDVLNATRLAGCRPSVTAALVDALTLGWVDRTLDDYFTDACVDPLTELASLPYLMTRLAEIYAEAAMDESDPSVEFALVVVVAAERSDPLEAETQMIATQVALRLAFGGGETLARIGPRCAIALSRRHQPRFGRSLGVLRDELGIARAENRLPGARVWIESLPKDRDDLPSFLREINNVRD